MTFYAITNADGELISTGTVIADPLPHGLTATALDDADAALLYDGAGLWDQATRGVIARPPEPATEPAPYLVAADEYLAMGKPTQDDLIAQVEALTRVVAEMLRPA